MSDICRVSVELNQWQSEQWDCECDIATPDIICSACLCHDEDYFDEDDDE